ncbi:hypothetical protein BDAP_001477 [Binucleata daphniae]
MAKGSTVFVGNIDFEVTESKVIEELSKIGKVVSFRMIIDKQTGKHKGYAFCEYESPLIADTAVQKYKITLNNRQLKINYADTDYSIGKKENDMPVDNFIQVLKQMDRNNLKDVLLYLKRMAIDQPKRLKTMLEENKNLGIAIFQALIELEFIDKETVYMILKKNFSIENNQVQLLERLCQLTDEDLSVYDEKTKEKVSRLRDEILKKREQ